jgi:hypothetical protein
VVFKSFWTQPEVVFTCSDPWTLLVAELLRLIYAVLSRIFDAACPLYWGFLSILRNSKTFCMWHQSIWRLHPFGINWSRYRSRKPLQICAWAAVYPSDLSFFHPYRKIWGQRLKVGKNSFLCNISHFTQFTAAGWAGTELAKYYGNKRQWIVIAVPSSS